MEKKVNKTYKGWEIIKLIQENKIKNKTIIKETKGFGIEYIYYEAPDHDFLTGLDISLRGLYRKGNYKNDIIYFEYPWWKLFLANEDVAEWEICKVDENKIKIYPFKKEKEKEYLPIYEEN